MHRAKPDIARVRQAYSALTRFALSLSVCFVASIAATLFTSLFVSDEGPQGSILIWMANGVLLAYLLLAPKSRWIFYLSIGFIGQIFAATLLFHHFLPVLFVHSTLNILEVLLAAHLMRRRASVLPNFIDEQYLLRFLGFAVILTPALISLFFGGCLLLLHIPLEQNVWTRIVADALGIAICTPTVVAILRWRSVPNAKWRERGFLLLLLLAFICALCLQNQIQMLFLVYPFLVIILLSQGMGSAAVATLILIGGIGFFTSKEIGPIATFAHAIHEQPVMLLQRMAAGAVMILFSVSAVIEKRRTTERKLKEIVTLHKLVTENNRDVIVLANLDGTRRYVSSSSTQLCGWTPKEVQMQGSLDLVHPNDLPTAHEALAELRMGNPEILIEVRIRKKDGNYVWVESVLRLIKDQRTGAANGILNIVRDISERKLAEAQLREAYNAVEALAITDSLTGLANRRRLDQYLASEWRRSMRERTPLSLLMLDADHFKAYNDTYGHARGDSCLRQISEAAQDVVSRPGDLVSRFGGEEFAVVLPNTDQVGALKVAEDICAALRARRLPHEGNEYGIITISIGCGTIVPKFGLHAVNLIELADKALYDAKSAGRNCVRAREL